jgi:hypothetical protein
MQRSQVLISVPGAIAGPAKVSVDDPHLSAHATGRLILLELDLPEHARRPGKMAVLETGSSAPKAELVVQEPWARLGEGAVGRRDFTEPFFGCRRIRDVGVEVPSQAPKGAADLLAVGRLRHAEHLVVVALRPRHAARGEGYAFDRRFPRTFSAPSSV